MDVVDVPFLEVCCSLLDGPSCANHVIVKGSINDTRVVGEEI